MSDALTETDTDAATATEQIERDVERAVRGVLDVSSARASTPVWIVTRGAMPVSEEAPAVHVTQAPLWGLGRVLAVERPGSLGALVDLDPAQSSQESARDLLKALMSPAGEDMLAFRSGVRFMPRLKRIEDGAIESRAIGFDAARTVLITGGSGGLGLRLAAWLVERGASHLILVSRRAPSPDAQADIDRLRDTGVDIVSVRADVADYLQLKPAIDRAATGRPPITGIFHLAGVLDDGALAEQTWERFARVLKPKVDGAWNLHRLSRNLPIEQFVMFSSVASVVAVAGQANYAAANAFLDALAHHRRAAGVPALAVNWGPWAEVATRPPSMAGRPTRGSARSASRQSRRPRRWG